MKEVPCAGCGAIYLKLLPSSNNRCCRCREKSRSAKHERITKRPEQLPGAFTSAKAVQKYLDTDELTCLLCGWYGSGLFQHLTRAHGVAAMDYKLAFGIPLTCGLIGRTGKAALARQAPHASKTTLRKMHKARRERTNPTRAPQPEYAQRKAVEALLASPRHPSKLEGIAQTVCTKCGDTFYQSKKIVLSMQCRARCDACATKREYKRKWEAKRRMKLKM